MKKLFIILLFFIGTIFVKGFTEILFDFVVSLILPSFRRSLAWMLLRNISYLTMLLFTFLFVMKTEKLNFIETLKSLGIRISGIKTSLILALIIIFLMTLPSLIFPVPPYPKRWWEEGPLWYAYAWIFLFIFLTVPTEEIAYRGYVLGRIVPEGSRFKIFLIPFGLILSSFLHAIWHTSHFMDFKFYLVTTLLGIIDGAVFLKTRNILGPVIIHAYENIYPYSIFWLGPLLKIIGY